MFLVIVVLPQFYLSLFFCVLYFFVRLLVGLVFVLYFLLVLLCCILVSLLVFHFRQLLRRMERYRIIYVWKILEGISPNCGLEVTTSERRGREVKIPPIKGTKGKIQNLRENSFQIQGPRLFNCLPKSVRGISKVSIDDFKQHLDRFLEKLPDEPKVENYIPSACNIVTASPTNSVVDLARTVRTRRPG